MLNLCNKKSDHKMYTLIIWCIHMMYGVWQIYFWNFRQFFLLLPHHWPWKLKFEKMWKTPGDIILLHMYNTNQDHMMYGSWDIKAQDRVFCYFGPSFALWHSWKPKKSKFWKNLKKHLEILSFHTCVPQMPVIWCVVAEIIECNRLPICSLPPIYPMIYGSWDMKCNRHNFFVILGHFSPFYPPNSPQKWKFHKNEKNTWRYHSTQVYQNDDHMLYCSWDMTHDRCNCYF